MEKNFKKIEGAAFATPFVKKRENLFKQGHFSGDFCVIRL